MVRAHRRRAATAAAAHVPHDQPSTGADGMIVCGRLVRIYSGEGIEVQALLPCMTARQNVLLPESYVVAVNGGGHAARSRSSRWRRPSEVAGLDR